MDATRGAAGATAGVGVTLEIGVSGTCGTSASTVKRTIPVKETFNGMVIHGDPMMIQGAFQQHDLKEQSVSCTHHTCLGRSGGGARDSRAKA